VRDFGLAIEHAVCGERGYAGDKVVAAFTYTAASGRIGKTAVFVKRFREPGTQEAFHHAHLVPPAAPVAHQHGHLIDPEGREISFLEYLRYLTDPARLFPCFDDFFMDADRLLPFLDLGARFNAIHPSEEYRAELHVQTTDQVRRWLWNAAEALGRVWECAAQGRLGGDLADLCRDTGGRLPRLQQLAADLVAPVSELPTGLVHGDFYPEHALWREQTDEFVLVDLEGVALRPRFMDVARWVGAPDDVQSRCLPQRELAERYLDSYRRWGGAIVPLSELLEEIRPLVLLDHLMMLPFSLGRSLDGEVDWTEDREAARRTMRGELCRKLRALLRMLPT
jgi:hypothetical protein